MASLREIDFLNPDFVRLASYLAAAGKTWKDLETGKLRTIVRGKYMNTVYPLFVEFFPKAKRYIVGNQNDKGESHITFEIADHEILDMLESGGFYLGSKKRTPPLYVIKDPNLCKIYLSVIWEVHGRVSSIDPLQVNLEQKYPQELRELKKYLDLLNISCDLIKTDDNSILHFSGPESVKSFLSLFDFKADGPFGKSKIDKLAHLIK